MTVHCSCCGQFLAKRKAEEIDRKLYCRICYKEINELERVYNERIESYKKESEEV